MKIIKLTKIDFFQENFSIFYNRHIIWEVFSSQQKISFECSFIAQNPFQTILGLWKTFEKIFEIFSEFEAFSICNAKFFLLPLKWYSQGI